MSHAPVPPGATIGFLGGGQLGRMAAIAASSSSAVRMRTRQGLPRRFAKRVSRVVLVAAGERFESRTTFPEAM